MYKRQRQETLSDQPFVDKSKARVTGPFTVEAVPAPVVKPLEEVDSRQLSGAGEEGDRRPPTADRGIARSGETLRQAEWLSLIHISEPTRPY